jgi:hypothetical protein
MTNHLTRKEKMDEPMIFNVQFGFNQIQSESLHQEEMFGPITLL